MSYALTFVRNTAAYRAHAANCCAAVENRNKALLPMRFETVQDARAWADADESNKAGAKTRANFKACECCK